MERLNPLNDFLFKKLFGDEKDSELLIGLLNAILGTNIVELTIAKEQLNRDTQGEKLGILDIKAKVASGEKINIEVQLLDQKNMVPRTLFYWSKLFVEDFEAGSEYRQLKKTATINILDFELEQLRMESYHTKYNLREFHSNTLLTDLMEIHFIEFPKFEELELNLHNPLHRWLLFLKKDVPENLLEEAIHMDAMVNKAEDKLMKLSADPETRRQYELRAKALSDERSRLEDAREEGMEKGIQQGIQEGIQQGIQQGMQRGIQQGMQQGIQQGMQQGIHKGMQEGKEQGVLDVVKRLIDAGMPLQEAAEFTPYSVEELQQLLENEM